VLTIALKRLDEHCAASLCNHKATRQRVSRLPLLRSNHPERLVAGLFQRTRPRIWESTSCRSAQVAWARAFRRPVF